ncbi:family 10 glycosylhydrolase [candidate division KSB1 bacterium]|nr:family 10 glycosylhydrolase [candidate division KSB1 bacterium]NIR70104.1 family 10 glycosylhydrolase [candidate division KSB1 bacterium]NIS27529.1 family 10 glycosylhydrolase [candidate division KSB1 bacterium]NIT74380.1 family 10 glycosylhydrolase [candidate division KSB1 bacterium]NIU28247.1 family 10 glycosylhydrolase [candidate division KSB1 bacterium]
MKRIAVLIFLCILPGHLVSRGNQEFRATWIVDTQWLSVDKTVEENKALTRLILDNHVAANMTSVLWQVRRFGTAYFPSEIEPWGPQTNFLNPGYDPLQYALEQAHERGLEFHAWFNTFESRYQYTGSPSQVNPDWICRDRDGVAMPSGIAWLSPGLASVREYLVNVAMEIVNNYDIDGLHLDFVRWNEHTNSGLSVALAKENLQKELPDGIISEKQLAELQSNAAGRYLYDVEHAFSAGVPDGFSSWEDWWRWSVTEFVKTLHDSIQAVKPWVRLSPAALGRYNWGGWQGFDVVYQDAALWLNQGYIDQLIGMHYHWSLPFEFKSVLVSGCPNCWSQYIQPAISAGRLYTVGLFSDNFAVKKIFGRHTSIIDEVRDISWVDGFQFFSYASWRDNLYWDEASAGFFPKKTKIRATGLIDDVPPEAPSIVLTKLDSLNYQIKVKPTNPVENKYWFAVYRSEDEQLNVDDDEIIDVHFGNSDYSYKNAITGKQDFNGTYTYFATAFDRYWNESNSSNSAQSDKIPSFAPVVERSLPAEGDTISVNGRIVIEFSKTIDTASANSAISIEPSAPVRQRVWSDDSKVLTILFDGNLQFDTDYTLTVSPALTDINGRPIDGNSDGMEGDAFVLHFRTLTEDIFAPQIVSSFPDLAGAEENFAIDDVVTFVFNELLDAGSVSTSSIHLTNSSGDVPFGYHIATVGDRSVLSVQALDPLQPNDEYTITLAPEVADTSGNQIGSEISTTFKTSPEHYSELILIDQFLSLTNWRQPNFSGSTTGIIVPNTTFNMTTGAYLPSAIVRQRISPTLEYEWDENANEWLIRLFLAEGAPLSVEFDTTYILQCYVFGDGSNNKFRFAIDDNLPTTAAGNHEVSNWITIDWIGWRIVEWKLSDPNSVGIWIGDGVPEGQLRFDSFQLTHESGDATSGKVYFDNLRLVKKSSTPVTVASDETQVPDRFQLFQNYPNPFNPTTAISFDIPETGLVTLKVYDMLGREVVTVLKERKAPGSYKINFDASGLATGVYIYQMTINGKAFSRRMLYVK